MPMIYVTLQFIQANSKPLHRRRCTVRLCIGKMLKGRFRNDAIFNFFI